MKKKYIAIFTLNATPSCSTKTYVTHSDSIENAKSNIKDIIKEIYEESDIRSVKIHEIIDSSDINLCEIYPENVGCEYFNRFKWDEMD
tara:strand:+ start:84929 stop:85192 length:264 start_codon:yes stop_codon:yes gene_type:complete